MTKYFFKKSSERKVSLALIYPIYFLAGVGVVSIVGWFLGLYDLSMDFNLMLRSWWKIILFVISAIVVSGFIWLIHEYIEDFTKGQPK